jgi:hypothetical protein
MPKLKKKKAKKKVVGGALLALLSLTFAGRALTADDTFHNCNGKERWDVKTLEDKAASQVDYTHVLPATIKSLSQIPLTFNPNVEAEFFRHPEETKVYQLKNCKIDLVKKETSASGDGDYHLVITQGNNTMIGEIPDYHCENNKESPAIEVFKKVRTDFQPLLNGKRYKDHTYDITGVAFFDPPHHQTGRNEANGIELHPILDIKIH